jgi:hypothetical protein
MEFKDGIYLRQFSPCIVKIKKHYVYIIYTAWDEKRGMWEYNRTERMEKKTFEVLNREPSRTLFYYAEKWDYGETKTALINGKEIPEQHYKLRKTFVDRKTFRKGENPTPCHKLNREMEDIMFTVEEKKLLKYVLKQKLEIAKEVTKCAIKDQRKLCRQTEKVIESILQKIG